MKKIKPMDKASGSEMRARKGHTTHKIHKKFYDKMEKYFQNKDKDV